MQIIVPDASYGHEDEVDRDEFILQLKAELDQLSGNVSLRNGDIGLAASWPIIVATLSGLFFLGKPINDSLDAWISLAKKFATTLKWILSKCGVYRVDRAGASLIALKAILVAEGEPISSIELVSCAFIPFWTHGLRDPSELDHHPDGLFTQTFVVNRARVYLFAIKSNGSIESQFVHPIQEWHEF